ncbi:HAMP domain-containing histidine kinase [candidate division WWE3 bacterium]|nr:HAMP domain-containing histidine kinase [candidate division WWE3 bacterium]
MREEIDQLVDKITYINDVASQSNDLVSPGEPYKDFVKLGIKVLDANNGCVVLINSRTKRCTVEFSHKKITFQPDFSFFNALDSSKIHYIESPSDISIDKTDCNSSFQSLVIIPVALSLTKHRAFVYFFPTPRPDTYNDTVIGTLLKRYIEDSLRKNASKSTFHRNISELRTLFVFAAHELKNPLTTIKLYAHYVQSYMKKKSAESKFIDAMDTVNSEIFYLTNKINDITVFTRLSLGIFVTNIARFDLIPLINRVISHVSIISESRKIHCVCPTEELFISADRSRIEHVLTALLTNAITYSDDGSEIIIDAGVNATHAWILVHDQGPGISPALIRRYNAGITDTHNNPHLGMYLTKKIIQRHNGTMRFICPSLIHNTNSQNVGTTVEILLPLTT